MSLLLYSQLPAASGTQCDPVASFVAGAGQVTYALPSDLPATSLGGTIQSQNTQYKQLGTPAGFTKDTGANTFTLGAAPVTGATVIAPGIIRMLLVAYDQTTISGLSNPNISQTPAYLIDSTDIANSQYLPTYGNSAILAQVVDLDSVYGADATWCQLGYATPATGAPSGTWNSPGAALNLPSIGTYSPLSSNVAVNATTIPVTDGTQFPISQTTGFVMLDVGLGTQEIVQILGVTGNNLTTSATTYAHVSGNNAYFCGVKFYIQLTLPTNLGSASFLDLATQVVFDEIDR